MWGEIGTDKKALITIQLEEIATNIIIHAFPKEEVSKELQDALFVEWKNGGEFAFPETAYQWTVSANEDNILPENIRVERPEIVTQTQRKWSRKLMSFKVNQLLNEETDLILQNVESLNEYDQSLWDKAKQQWNKIADYQKKGEISWEQTTLLKEKINQAFDALKAVKRINSEHDDEKSHHLFKSFHAEIDQLQSRLIYPDEWKKIFDRLIKMQEELKTVGIKWSGKKKLYDKINEIYEALKKYRSTEFINRNTVRIKQLKQVLSGLHDAVAREKDNYDMQVNKMHHYTRGRLHLDEIKKQFNYILDRINDKEQKIKSITKSIKDLEKEIHKEQHRQEQKQKKAEEAKEAAAQAAQAKHEGNTKVATAVAAEESIPVIVEEETNPVAVAEESVPVAAVEESVPVVVEETIPVVAEESVPAVAEESISAVAEESVPAVAEEEPIPVVAEESIPVAVAEESVPAVVTEESVLAVTEESIPAAAEESVPVVVEELIPVVAEEVIPVTTAEVIPVATEESIAP
jgi:tetratricopeptide (TPR) repeat protein